MACQAKTPDSCRWRQGYGDLHLPLQQLYAYRLPEICRADAAVGKRALVPFGKRRLTGYIVTGSHKVDPRATKEILALLDETPIFTAEQLELFQWVAGYYMAPLGEVIATALPTGLELRDALTLCITTEGRSALATGRLEEPEKKILAALGKRGCRLTRLQSRPGLKATTALLQRLEKAGWVTRQRRFNRHQTVRHKTERIVSLPDKASPGPKCSPTRRQILATLADRGSLPLARLKQHCPTAPNVVPKMAADGQVIYTASDLRVGLFDAGETAAAVGS